jgi:REP element-mobilizing transposase RayT
MDRLLGEARSGPRFLSQPAIAALVADTIENGEAAGRYDNHAWVIMPNHVHLLLTAHLNVSEVLRSLKGCTARQANLLLHRSGQPFWQDESYDHLVRNIDEFRRIQRYIENNPFAAGLIAAPEEYRWYSARGGLKAAADSPETHPRTP